MKKKITGKQVLTKFIEYVWVSVAGILNAVSLFTFVNPAKLIAGGFSGLSSALSYVFNVLFPSIGFDNLMSIIYFVLNVPLLICSLILLRGDFTFKTIWATVVSTVVLAILPRFPIELKFHDSRLISIIFGGILVGSAMYIASENNGSNGGTEVIAKIVAKYHPETDLSKVILIANCMVTVTGSILVMVLENQSVEIVLYSFMYILLGAHVMGMLKRGFNHPQKFCIVTANYEEIGEQITTHFKRGYTMFDVENSYDGQVRKMIMVVIQYRQMPKMKQIIRKYDASAFTFVKDVYDVFSRPTFNRSYKTK